MSDKPLKGIKVVELSTYVAAPSTARILCDLGAEVIKVEAFSGDQWRESGMKTLKRGEDENPIFDVYNTGKSSICINIKHEDGLKCMMRILADADVFITNVRSQSLKKLGLDAEALTEKYPRLVYASIDGFGNKGPDANSPGFDNISFWARSGFAADVPLKTDDSYPMPSISGVGDCISGGFLISGILASLYKRERTGRGDIVNISLYGVAIWVMSSMLLRAAPQYGDPFPLNPKQGDALAHNYKCADGEWCNVAVRAYDKDAAIMYELWGITEEVEKLGDINAITYFSHAEELIPMITKAMLTKTSDEWIELFRKHGLVIGRLPHIKDIITDEQAWANGFVEEFENRNGVKSVMACPPIHLASYEKDASKPAPRLGEQTEEILLKYGFSADDIEKMRQDGAVK